MEEEGGERGGGASSHSWDNYCRARQLSLLWLDAEVEVPAVGQQILFYPPFVVPAVAARRTRDVVVRQLSSLLWLDASKVGGSMSVEVHESRRWGGP